MKPLRECPTCGRFVSVNMGGELRAHKTPDDLGSGRPGYMQMQCAGSGTVEARRGLAVASVAAEKMKNGVPIFRFSGANGSGFTLLIPSGSKPTHRLFTERVAVAMVSFVNEVWDAHQNCDEYSDLEERIVQMHDDLIDAWEGKT